MTSTVGHALRHGRWSPALTAATARALLLAVGVEAAVRWVPLDRLAPWLGIRLAAGLGGAHPAEGSQRTGPSAALSVREARDCRAVGRVAGRWPGSRGTCLREALLYGHALRLRAPLLHLGAGVVDGRLLGHAWLSYDGGTLGQRPDVLELTGDGFAA